MDNQDIPFNRPYVTGKESDFIKEAHSLGALAGDGHFTKLCHLWLKKNVGAARALLTHSCTAALEMSALLLDIRPGDEVIMPSYTFVSTANAFVLRGGVPVFVDIREDTLNIDETLIEDAITGRTKAIVPVHYAGVSCEMDKISEIAKRHDLKVIEDAAQGILATYKGKPLGGLGELGAFSFHETKNIISGEGGALLINDEEFVERAEIIREKGADRSRFFRGEVDKYTWQDLGSSFLPGELVAAFLAAQLEEAGRITSERHNIWQNYHRLIKPLEEEGWLRRPVVPAECGHNAHIYYIVLAPELSRQNVLDSLKTSGVHAIFHYIPLHSSPAGRRFGRAHEALRNTEHISEKLIRLPVWIGLTDSQQARVVSALRDAIRECSPR